MKSEKSAARQMVLVDFCAPDGFGFRFRFRCAKRLDLFQTVGGDVGGDEDGVETLDADHHAVLPAQTDYLARDAFEGSAGDADGIIANETAFGDVCFHDMDIMEGRDTNQGFYVALRDGKRWVVAELVGFEMIVIIGDEPRHRAFTDVVLGLLRGDIGEDEVQEGDQHATTLTVFQLVFPYHGEVSVGAVIDEEVGDLLGIAIEDSENVPFLIW